MRLVRFSSAEKACDNSMLRPRSPELSFDSAVGTLDNEDLSSDSRDEVFDESLEVSDNCVRMPDSCIRTLDGSIWAFDNVTKESDCSFAHERPYYLNRTTS